MRSSVSALSPPQKFDIGRFAKSGKNSIIVCLIKDKTQEITANNSRERQ